jgi:hypothetical protein
MSLPLRKAALCGWVGDQGPPNVIVMCVCVCVCVCVGGGGGGRAPPPLDGGYQHNTYSTPQ